MGFKLTPPLNIALAAVIYFVTAQLGLYLAFENTNASPVWPPAGIALACVVICGRRNIAGIWIGAFAANLLNFVQHQVLGSFDAVMLSTLIASGNTLEAWIGSLLLQKALKSKAVFTHYNHVFKFFLACLPAALVSSLIGVSSLLLFGIIEPNHMTFTWQVWFLGDVSGMVILTPTILFLKGKGEDRVGSRAEMIAIYSLTLAITTYIFLSINSPYLTLKAYLIFPFLMWAAFRTTLRQISILLTLVALLVIVCTVHKTGPFASGDLVLSLLELQSFVTVIVLSFLALGGTLYEHRSVRLQLVVSKDVLESRVMQRTAALQNKVKELQKTERDLEVIQQELIKACDIARLGHFQWDAVHDKVYWSKQVYEIFGVTEETFDSSFNGYASLLHPDDREWVLEVIQKAYVGKEPYELLHRVVNPGSNAVKWVSSKGSVNVNAKGEVIQIMGTVHDITNLKEAENREQEIVQETVRLKDQFMANMSHEIRTPMNAIVGFTDLLDRSDLKAEQREYLAAIKSSGINLLTIINDILDLSKIHSGKIQIERTPMLVGDICHNLCEIFIPRAREKGLSLSFNNECERGLSVWGDPVRLSQILMNLISNALKFTESGSVELGMRMISGKEDNMTIEFWVQDSGIGIPNAKVENIFDRFTQASSDTNRKYGGTGLGLSIVKGLVDIQGGEIQVISEEGKGSCFRFQLHYEKYKDAEQIGTQVLSKPADVDFDLKGIKLLLVEDNRMNQKLAVTVLTQVGFEVELAENGLEAVDKLTAPNDFHLVLMDIQMPLMDGYKATQVIRSELNLTIPIVAMTAHAMAGERDKCLSLGMNDYVSKPFQRENLIQVIRENLARSNKAVA